MFGGRGFGWLGCTVVRRGRVAARSLAGALMALALFVGCVSVAWASSAKPTLRLTASPSIVRLGGVVTVRVTGSRRICRVALVGSGHVIRRWTTKRHRTWAFRVGNQSGALTVTARCGRDTRLAPVWVVSEPHASSVLLGFQPAAGKDAGGPIVASLLPSGTSARVRAALSPRHRGAGVVRDRFRAAGASVRSTIVSIAQSQRGVSSPAGSECNPYSVLWGDGYSCANGWRSNAWCADFAAWVWHEAGLSFPHGWGASEINAWSASFYSWGVATGNWHPLSSSYQPQPGEAGAAEYLPRQRRIVEVLHDLRIGCHRTSPPRFHL